MAIPFFTPRYIRDARDLLAGARKVLHYRRDLLSPESMQAIEGSLFQLQEAIARRSAAAVAEASREVERLAGAVVAPCKHPGWKENIEVLVVAIVLATGVRAFFLQPFKIPTGSMQPTLYGITAQPMQEPFPNPVVRFLEFFLLGRNYIDATSKVDDAVVSVSEKTHLNFFTFTTIQMEKERYTVFAPMAQIMGEFGVRPGRLYGAGQTIARGRVDTGDQVLVDKVSYHFAPPQQGDVFVFKTLGILRIQNSLPPGVDSQHYIKRLAGMPGQVLRIVPPKLLVNGQEASPAGLRRVMSLQNGYRGYTNGLESGFPFQFLGSPEATFRVPPQSFFALGDNSYHSSDSRNWGVLPESNVNGRAFLTYWPFTKRWGLID